MTHLRTLKKGAGLDIIFYDGHGKEYIYHVRRTVIGISFPDLGRERFPYGVVCVVAERMFYGPEQREGQETPWDRQYVIVSEGRHQEVEALNRAVVEQKDRFLSSTVYCPDGPQSLIDRLRTTEGVTSYPGDPDRVLSERHPHFVGRHTTAYVRETALPSVEALRRDISLWLSQEVKDPETGMPLIAGKGTASRLALPADLLGGVVSRGLQTNDTAVVEALWLAVQGLEGSMRYLERPKEPGQQWERKVGRGGY